MVWRTVIPYAAAPLLLLLASCGDASSPKPVHELTGSAMGTSFSVKMVSPPISLSADALRQDVERTLLEIERQMSTYIADSELSRFNEYRAADWFEVSTDLCHVIADALSISAATDGAFDITVGPLVNLWGFGPAGAISEPPDAELIALLMDSVGHAALHTDCSVPALRKDRPDLYVDLSAFAKGYGVDQLAELLDGEQVHNYLVEIGGELRLRGTNASGELWAVAIETPNHLGRSVHSIARLTDAGVATSGDYRNFFEYDGLHYSHTIDPRTGYPVEHDAASVTVVADSAAFADAMATALLVLGPDDGLDLAERDGIAAYYLLRDGDEIEERASTIFSSQVSRQ